MSVALGRVTAQLEQPLEPVAADLVQLINTNVNPPTPVRPEDVHVRTLFIVSDEVNSFGGCFPKDEHERLAELIVDSPVLVGHRKDRLPIGRNFHATVVERDGRSWVKSYFYWLKSAAGSEDLRENIDGGIYKECSIAFTYGFPECSVCGRDIRICPHEPLTGRRQESSADTCHFSYREIERVLETSLVYRGAIPNTSISKDLTIVKSPAATNEPGECALNNNGAGLSITHCSDFDIRFDQQTDRGYLSLRTPEASLTLLLYQFSNMRFQKGARFMANACRCSEELNARLKRLPVLLSGRVAQIDSPKNQVVAINLDSDSNRQLIIRQLKADRSRRYVVYVTLPGKAG